MKKIIYLFIIAVSSVFSFPGCQKDTAFDIKNPPQSSWKTDIKSVDLGVHNTYSEFYGMTNTSEWRNGTWSGPVNVNITWDYVGSDMGFQFASTEIRRLDIYTSRDTKTESDVPVFTIWGKCFNAITSVNDMLDFINKGEATNANNQAYSVTAEAYNNIIPSSKGDLYFVRALAYFNLASLFGSPYYTEAALEPRIPKKFGFITDPLLLRNTPLMTSKEIFDSIASDLRKSKQWFAKDPNFISAPKDPSKWRKEGRGSYWAATALLARVYFMMGGEKDAEGLAECDEIMKNSGYTLEPEPINAFNKNINNFSNEVILEYACVAGPEWPYYFGDAETSGISKAFCNTYGGGRATKEFPKAGAINTWVGMVMSKPASIDVCKWMTNDYSPTAEALKDKRLKQLYCRFDTFYVASRATAATAFKLANLAKANVRPEDAYILNAVTSANAKAKIGLINWAARPAWLNDTIDYLNGYPRTGIAFASGWSNNQKINRPSIILDKYYRFAGGMGSTDPFLSGSATKMPMIRLAEVILTHAILAFKLGDYVSATTDINIIRKRAGLDDIVITANDRELIDMERARELTGEGDRYRYLMALHLPIGPGEKVDKNGSILPNIDAPYKDFYWSIPQGETNYNAAY